MDMQGALRARLVAAATAAGARVHWLERPQGGALPAITLQTISGDRPQHMAGFQGTRTARVQLDAWAERYETARAIVEAAVAALAPKQSGNGIAFGRMFFEGERDFTERLETHLVYRTSIDLIVWHAPA